MIHGFDVYRCYMAMKLHFSKTSYDFFEYDGKVKANEQTYQQRKDFWFFETLAKKHKKEEIQDYLLASFVQAEDPTKVWIGDIKRNGEDWYVVRQKQMERLSYSFVQDSHTVDDYMEREGYTFNSLFETEHSSFSGCPPFLKLYLKAQISLETFLIYDMILGFMKKWDKELTDPLWEGLSFKIKKYKSFLSIPVDKYRQLLKEQFCNA